MLAWAAMLRISSRLPFVRVAVWNLVFRRVRPGFVSGQGVRRCQIRERSWIFWESGKRVERSCAARSSWRESRWCWSTVFQVEDGFLATDWVKVR